MRQRKAIVVLSGLLGVAPVAAFAAAPAAPPAHREGRRSFVQQLGLSPDQTSQMQRLRDEFAKVQVRRRADIAVARIELRELMSAPQLDDKAIVAKAKILGDLEAAQTRDRIEHRLAMAKVLTPEQRAKAGELLAEHRGHGEWGRGFRERRGRFGRDGGPGWGAGRPGMDDPAPEHE